jgi:hypothetical protein
MNTRLTAVAVLIAVGCTSNPSAQRQQLFDFHSSFWMNLHTYLHALARVGAPIVEPLPETATASERERWEAAVADYRQRFGKRSLLFDKELADLTWRISHAGSPPNLDGAGIDAATRTLLEGVAPIYRRHRWPSHDAANRRFIDSLTPPLAKHGAAISARLAKSYGKTWHERPVRVDVIHDAGPPGNAHTVSDPLHITIGASDPRHQGHHALELIFHEASHGWDEVLMKDVGDAAARLGIRAPRNLWHAILFFNSGTITTDVLAAGGVRDYRQYMEIEKIFGDLRPAVARHWPAFLSAEISRDEAITRILKELAVK